MPYVGEVKYDKERERKYKWIKCPHCGKERWVEAWHYKRYGNSDYCRSCAQKYHRKTPRGVDHPNWKGGRFAIQGGYILVKLQPEDFYHSMANRTGYVLEHRLIMARALGRLLQSHEIVHHRDANRGNNDISNLELVTRNDHRLSYSAGYETGFADGKALTTAQLMGDSKKRVKVEV